MNRSDSNSSSSSDKRNALSAPTIQSDRYAQDASSGKSTSGREPQQGSAIDNSSTWRDAALGRQR